MRQASRCGTSISSHSPPNVGLPTQICFAVGLLVSTAAYADGLHFTENEVRQLIVATTTVEYIKVNGGVSASIGGDKLIYTGATENFTLGGFASNQSTNLSLADLNEFEFDNADQAFFVSGQASGPGLRSSATLTLAADNLITTSLFGIGNAARSGSTGGSSINEGTVILGQNNVINADTIIIGSLNATGKLHFSDDIIDGRLTLRGTGGPQSRVQRWSIGTVRTVTNADGSDVNLTHGTLDALVDVLTIGGSITGGDGKLTMAAGMLDANNIIIGQQSGATSTNGALIVNGGEVKTQSLILGDNLTDSATSATVDLNEDATLRARSIATGAGDAVRAINWNAGLIGNYAEDEDMSITGVDIKLSDVGTHEFRIDGANANATVDAVIADADISGSGGTLLKSGNGTLILEQTNTYRGDTTINDGMLVVNGALSNSNTTVSGGTLAGSGTVRNVSVADGGSISNALGSLTVDGDLHFGADGIYRFYAVDPLADNRIQVTGNTALGGKLDIRAGGGNFEKNRFFTILTTNGEQTGTFDELSSDLAFLTPRVIYRDHDVGLELQRNDIRYSGVARTPNQIAVATALDVIGIAPDGDSADVIDAVTALSADQARAAYDAIGGVGLAAVRRAAPQFAINFNNQLRARLATINASSNNLRGVPDSATLLAANEYAADLQPASKQSQFSLDGGSARDAYGRGLWLRAYGSNQASRSDDNAAASRGRISSFSVGFDTLVNHDVVVGAAITHGRTMTNAEHEKGDANGNAVAFYGSYSDGPWDVLGSIGVAQNNISTERHIAFGSIDRTATASFKMYTVAASGEVSYAMPMAGWTLQPLAGLAVNYNTDQGLAESGADSLNLQVAGEQRSTVQSQLGLKAVFTGRSVQWQPRLIWAHDFGNNSAPMSAQLQDSGAIFKLRGVAAPRDSLIAGMTIATQANQQVALFADVQGEFGSRQSNVSLLFGMRANW